MLYTPADVHGRMQVQSRPERPLPQLTWAGLLVLALYSWIDSIVLIYCFNGMEINVWPSAWSWSSSWQALYSN